MKLDLLVAAASAGLLLYSGRLLVLTARFRPEDIIAEPRVASGQWYTSDPAMTPWATFPEQDVLTEVRDVLDGKAGFDLLVFGTIGSVIAVMAGSFSSSGVSVVDVVVAVAVLGFGYGTGYAL